MITRLILNKLLILECRLIADCAFYKKSAKNHFKKKFPHGKFDEFYNFNLARRFSVPMS